MSSPVADHGPAATHDTIAIIGMSGRFPGAPTVERFWENLRAGVESVRPLSREQLVAAGVSAAAMAHPSFVPVGSVLEDIDLFDAGFFGFSPREAESLDPQQRLFLETSWHALEDAGYDPATFPGQIGVYGGCAMSSYFPHLQRNPEFMALLGYLQVYIGNEKDYLATRVSYGLNLKGPSFTVQTACSTSLLAVAIAGDQLLSRQCDMALAGGVCVRVPQESGYYFEPGGIFSPDGHCRVFDERAAGVVFGNGVGVVVLRRLADALADGDPIYAVLRGWAVNNDGAAKGSYAAPSLEGQASVITRAHAHARVDARTITYVEAHGTGTPIGDPIEIGALTEAFRASTDRTSFCAVGSVKTNVGHLDPAAGVASLVKTVLALEHREIPASLNCESVNPALELAGSPFYVNTELAEWTVADAPRRAGVSGFGIGGTNVHLVLEEAPMRARAPDSRPHQLYVLSAHSDAALRDEVEDLAEHLLVNPGLAPAAVAYTLQAGRRPMERRCAAVTRDLDDLVGVLATSDSKRLLVSAQASGAPSVAFMFSGQGAQYVNMGLGLYQSEPYFRESVDHCAQLLEPHLQLDLREILYPSARNAKEASTRLTQTAFAQPALFTLEHSLAQLWLHWGIRPDIMIGHSIGEYVAACLAEVFTLADGLALVAERGRLMQSVPRGSMLAVALGEPQLKPYLSGALDLAATNETQLSVLSGPTAEIDDLVTRLQSAGVSCQRLHTSHAFHSRMMDAILDPFTEYVSSVELAPPQIPYVSNVTGALVTDAQAQRPEYWARHLRRPVRFAEGLQLVFENPDRVALELGPGQSLCSFARRSPARLPEQLVLPSLRHPRDTHPDSALMLESLGRLWLAGAEVDWQSLHAPNRPGRVHLPGYPFERQRYWADPADSGPPAVVREADIADWFYLPSWEYVLAPEPAHEEPARWLLFDDGALGPCMAERLAAEGHAVTVVRRAGEFGLCEDGTYTVDPGRREDYVALLAALAERGPVPDRILHLWTVGPSPAGAGTGALLEHWQRQGFFSIMYVAQALLSLHVTSPVELVVVSTGVHAVGEGSQLIPTKAPLLGACKAVTQEYPHIACRSVDIDVDVEDLASVADAAARLVPECLDEEMPAVIAYRHGQRWRQVFTPVRIEEDADAIYPLRRRGVYMITGGLGRIGLTLAYELARAVRARLVLVTRSPFPEPERWEAWLDEHPPEDDATSARIRALLGLEEMGSEVLVIQADVAEAVEMQEAVRAARARFGRLHGVIHGAGNVTGDGFFGVDEADPERCERQFAAKARGVIALEAALRRQRVDFVVLLSSISSILAGLGYVAYGAANAFLDAFAHAASRVSRSRWLTINWDTWAFEEAPLLDVDPTLLAMDADEGAEAFRRVLAWVPEPQVVVSTGDLSVRLDQWTNLRTLRKGMERRDRKAERFHSRPEFAPTHVAPLTALEGSVAEMWEDVLGVRPVGRLDNFFTDLGGSSLLATQLMSRVRAQFGVDVPLRRFFEAPTVAELVENLDADRSELSASPQ